MTVFTGFPIKPFESTKALFLGFGAREKRPGVRGAGTRDDPLRTSAWEASPEDEVAFERRLFLMFLPEVAYYATNNSNHVFFFFLLFSLSFLKVCFHTILNKSKNIVFHINLPPVALYVPLTDFRLQSLAISPRYYLSGGCFSSRICKFHCFG